MSNVYFPWVNAYLAQCLNSVLNVKGLIGACKTLRNLREGLFEAPLPSMLTPVTTVPLQEVLLNLLCCGLYIAASTLLLTSVFTELYYLYHTVIGTSCTVL